MASTSFSAALLITTLLIVLQVFAPVLTSARNVPTITDSKIWIGKHDRSFLIPGIGRVIVPKKGEHVNPFTYNPTTGKNGGNGVSIPGLGVTTGRSYIPGGDDLPLPNPGVEVPVPRH